MFTDDKGYLESFGRDFIPDDNPHLSENGVHAFRTMNTLIHILEAYTELYRINKETNDQFVKRKIYKIVDMIENKVYNPEKGRLEVFFDENFNSLIDLRSMGHDIEMSWFLDRLCQIMDDDNLTARLAPISQTLAEKTLEYGFDGDSLAYEIENGVTKETRAWWIQAESVVGFVNAFMKTGNKEFKNAERKNWEFIRKHMIMQTRPAEWYQEVSKDGVPDLDKPIVDEWKCPYHNVRMCCEILRRNERASEEL